MAENSSNYWLPELPPAEDRLAEADSKLTREFLDECEYSADCLRTTKLLAVVFWYSVTVILLAFCVWGAMCL